ncbi:sushi domain-containing protein 1 isoform 1-T1 [Menidia menidia]
MGGRTGGVVMVSLLLVLSALEAEGQIVLDVCASCHANATCEDKPDGSGKVCNCKYGFVGNGRTFCQDKDECQIGANKICGQHTMCHNTYGSYFCTCLAGYSPSNSMPVFIPNDGTHCQDIDECRVTGLCGEGAQCRNLEGSFDCSCQVGYRVHGGSEPFHPQMDSAFCKVVDCGQPASVEDSALQSISGTTFGSVATFVCEDGFVWRRGENMSVCGADGRWRGATLVCEEILCGNPPLIESTEQVWNNSTTPGSSVLYYCKEGFYNKGGRNVSICNENGQWTPPALSCQEISCSDPPVLPHAGQMWNGSSTPGSTVIYFCEAGFFHSGGNNLSVCTNNGNWTKADILCKAVDCGEPLPEPNAVMLWDKTSTVGSQVAYECARGYVNVGKGNISVCSARGKWEGASLSCQEISCGEPNFKRRAKMLWSGSSRVGSVVHYRCEEGCHTRGLRNHSRCGENGLWEDVDLWCEGAKVLPAGRTAVKLPHVCHLWCCFFVFFTPSCTLLVCLNSYLYAEIRCGPPLILPDTNPLWDGKNTPGAVVVYECLDGFYQESGNNISTCSQSGKWGEVTVKCKAKCGPVPFLPNAEVVWHNRSVAVHRCVAGFHSWRGNNASTCRASGAWRRASLTCVEIKPPVNLLVVHDGNCLRWRAEKYEEDEEVYRVTYTGSRDYQIRFEDGGRRFLSSREQQPELCLRLLPLTNYSISVTATSVRFTATVTANTSLAAPAAPDVFYEEHETPVPTLRLHRSPDTLDPISVYQVFVLPVEGIMTFDCSSPASLASSSKIKTAEYITAQINVRNIGTEFNFTVGDGLFYGSFYNALLESGRNYYIILRAVNQWKTASKSFCVLWAKVSATSYVLRVSSLSAAAMVGVAALVLLWGYSFAWCVKNA